MGRSVHVTPSQRQKIVQLRKQGMKYRDIGEKLQLAASTCIKACQHVQKTGTVPNEVKIRHRKTSDREDRIMHRISEADRHKTAVDVHSEVIDELSAPVSVRTAPSKLNIFGLMGMVSCKKPFISKKNQKKRFKFAREHVNWTEEQWSKVLWTDESKFCSKGSDGKTFVRRRSGEEFFFNRI